MWVSATSGTNEINGNDTAVITYSCGEPSDIFPESYTEVLLPSEDSPSMENYSAQVELAHTSIEEKVNVYSEFTLH